MMTSALRSAVREVLTVATRRTLTLAPTTQRWATTGHGTTEAGADEAAPSAESNVTIDGVLGLYAHNSPGTLAFFMSDRFDALPANVKASYTALLLQKKVHREIFDEFHKGELTKEQTAEKLGLQLPEEGVYTDRSQLVPPGQGGHKMFTQNKN
eukprot:m.459526 g.459526  ORF g.459526 m.459526 type:complete len:154 (-) comp21775_c0_seq1:177-638(-)